MKYLACLVGAVLAVGSVFTSCKLDEPDPIPAEELYLRAFIQKYGLIDPNQDWNQAQRSSVTVKVDHANTIYVFVNVEEHYYRVATYLDVNGEVEIPIDVPEACNMLYILADNDYRDVELGGYADFTTKRKGLKKAPEQAGWISDWNTTTATNTQTGGSQNARASVNIPTEGYIDMSTCAYIGTNDGRPTDSGGNVINVQTYTPSGQPMYKYAMYKTVLGTNLHFRLVSNRLSAYRLTFQTANDRGGFRISAVVRNANNIFAEREYDILNTGESHGVYSGVEGKYTTHTMMIPALPAGEYQLILTCIQKGSSSNQAGEWGNIAFESIGAETLGWLLVAEDLGATDDFDFNDVIIRVQSQTTNVANLNVQNEYWQVIQDENTHLVFSSPAPRRNGAGRAGETYTNLTIEAMCAGGTLDSYLHFVTKADKDVVLCPTTDVVDITESSFTASHLGTKATEWHSWFTKNDNTPLGAPNKRLMINTGLNDGWVGGKCNITVEGDFSVANYSDIRFRDYDGLTGDGNDYWDQNKLMTSWTYGSNVEDYAIYGFYITVGDAVPAATTRLIGAPKTGAAPQMFCIPDCNARGLWHWPRERVPIVQVYTGFRDWVCNNGNKDWYLPQPVTVGVTTHEGVPDLTAVCPRQGD